MEVRKRVSFVDQSDPGTLSPRKNSDLPAMSSLQGELKSSLLPVPPTTGHALADLPLASPRQHNKHRSPRSQQRIKKQLNFSSSPHSPQLNTPDVEPWHSSVSSSPESLAEPGVLSSRTLVGLPKSEAAAAYVQMKFPSPPPALTGGNKGSGSMRRKQHASPTSGDKQARSNYGDDDYTDTMSDMDHSEKDLSEGSDDDDRMQLIKANRNRASLSSPITPHVMLPPALSAPPPGNAGFSANTTPTTAPAPSPSKLAGLIPNHYYRHLLPQVVDIHADLPSIKNKTNETVAKGGGGKKLLLKIYMPNNVIKTSTL